MQGKAHEDQASGMRRREVAKGKPKRRHSFAGAKCRSKAIVRYCDRRPTTLSAKISSPLPRKHNFIAFGIHTHRQVRRFPILGLRLPDPLTSRINDLCCGVMTSDTWKLIQVQVRFSTPPTGILDGAAQKTHLGRSTFISEKSNRVISG
jgi:hypothetical protein